VKKKSVALGQELLWNGKHMLLFPRQTRMPPPSSPAPRGATGGGGDRVGRATSLFNKGTQKMLQPNNSEGECTWERRRETVYPSQKQHSS